MNIYIHVEIAARELDSRLMLAVLAASRGHHAMVSDLRTFHYLSSRGKLVPGIFHAKALTPSASKLRRHENLKQEGFRITSIDEESGLLDDNYPAFARRRFTDEALELADGTFCWGPMDRSVLADMFPEFRDRLVETGSPRVDLWQPAFRDFWGKPASMPERPYVLVTSNFVNANNYKRYWELLATNRHLFGARDDAVEASFFGRLNDELALVRAFQGAVRELAGRMPHLDFVVRPHPVEDPEAWRELLPRRDNIRVIRDGAITPWVGRALAVVHNGCTTAIEATLAGTPVIAYRPIDQAHEYEYANRFGARVETIDGLEAAIAEVERNGVSDPRQRQPKEDDLRRIGERIRIGDGLAAERTVAAWERIGAELPDRRNAWPWIGQRMRPPFKRRHTELRRFWRGMRGQSPQSPDYKFHPLSAKACHRKVDLLCECLGIRARPAVRKLGDRALLVAPAQ